MAHSEGAAESFRRGGYRNSFQAVSIVATIFCGHGSQLFRSFRAGLIIIPIPRVPLRSIRRGGLRSRAPLGRKTQPHLEKPFRAAPKSFCQRRKLKLQTLYVRAGTLILIPAYTFARDAADTFTCPSAIEVSFLSASPSSFNVACKVSAICF